MYWILLTLAGLFEVASMLALKYSEGLTKLKATCCLIVFGMLSVYCLVKSLKGIPISTAYSVWTGIGAAGTAVLGIVYFHEPYSLLRIFFITTLIISIVGLNLS